MLKTMFCFFSSAPSFFPLLFLLFLINHQFQIFQITLISLICAKNNEHRVEEISPANTRSSGNAKRRQVGTRKWEYVSPNKMWMETTTHIKTPKIINSVAIARKKYSKPSREKWRAFSPTSKMWIENIAIFQLTLCFSLIPSMELNLMEQNLMEQNVTKQNLMEQNVTEQNLMERNVTEQNLMEAGKNQILINSGKRTTKGDFTFAILQCR